jgi:hypothetical protein
MIADHVKPNTAALKPLLPRAITVAQDQLGSAVSVVERLRQDDARARAVLRRAPSPRGRSRRSTSGWSTTCESERGSHDSNAQTPSSTPSATDPRPAPAARQWDVAAGRLAQHQAVFDITDGLGRPPRALERNAYTESRADVENQIAPLLQPTPALRMQIEVPGTEP